jgi:putative ABC transport system permease protein
MRERLAQIASVKHVAVTNRLPYSGTETRKGRLRILGKSDEEMRFLLPVGSGDVHADFFETMNIGLVRGRYFERSDSPNAPPVVIINETGAKTLFGDQDPIGRMVQWGDIVGPSNPYCRIVGIVRDVKWEAAEQDTIQLYYPFTQWPVGTAYYLLRTDASEKELASQIRRVIQDADHKAAVVWIKSMTGRIDEALWQRRLWGVIFSAFAALAIVLAAVGLYGVLAYLVSQQTREIGIRIAIGAKPVEVSTMVLGRGMKLIFIGIAIGAAASFVAIRLLASLVARVAIQDWTLYAGVAAVVIVAGVVSAAGPALRACRVDPVIALREAL